MTSLGVEGSRFTTWWRKAKKEAEASEWFELSGPASRVQVRLLDEAADPAEGIRRQLARSRNLGEALARVRVIVAGAAAAEEVVAAALETLEGLAGDQHDAALADRLGTWLFLREERGVTPEVLRRTIAEAVAEPAPSDPSRPPRLWQLFQQIPGAREQERSIDLLREVLGPSWLDEAARSLSHAAPGMARGLVEALDEDGRAADLIAHYGALMARPTRNPILFVRLAEHIETGAHDAELGPPLRRAQCLLHLAVYLHRGAPGDVILTRARARLSELLTRGDPPLLRRLLADGDLESLRGLAALLDGGVDPVIDRLFTQVAVSISPDVFRGDERPFWQSSAIWTSRVGLRKRQEELRILRDVKIPANAEAIGVAASHGDLSENAEWEAAIAEQRILTQRAMELEADVRAAQLLEDTAIPPGTVAPGTAVTYRELDGNGEAQRVEIVGPWDIERDDQVSYRSPLAAGMLGARRGHTAQLELPSGTVRVEIVEIALLDYL